MRTVETKEGNGKKVFLDRMEEGQRYGRPVDLW